VNRLFVTAALLALPVAALGACGGAEQANRTSASRPRSVAGAGDTASNANAQGRCDATAANREVSEYDTSGDERPDVRKVFLQVGRAPLIRLVLICREADLNGDGTKDIVRYYNDEGRPLREEADRNFDGQMDEIAFFENGRVARTEADTNGDGKVDTKVFYERGQPVRSERDLGGHSTPERWQPDRWEYFEEGRMVRMGTDVNADGVVDRWDRDAASRPQLGSTREAANPDDVGAEGAAPAAAPATPPAAAPATTRARRGGTG
jgi:hypothetical protein